MYVIPKAGVLLRDPVTKKLLSAVPVEGLNVTVVPAEGMLVSDNDFYWLRRLRDEDAVRAPGPKAAAASSAQTPAAASAPDKTSI